MHRFSGLRRAIERVSSSRCTDDANKSGDGGARRDARPNESPLRRPDDANKSGGSRGEGATRDQSSLLRAGGRPLRAIKQVTFTLVWRAPRAGQANKSGGRAAGCDVQSKESLLPLPGCGRFTDGF